MKINILVLLLVFLTSCELQSCNNLDRTEQQRDYEKYKQNFEPTLVAHFPKIIHTPLLSIISNSNVEDNNICLMLFEFDIGKSSLNYIIKNVKNENIIATYKSTEMDLLYITPNKLDDNSSNSLRLATNINYSNQYPIADVSFYLENDKYFGEYANNDFDIYVFEAKSGKLPQYPKLQPNMNMPEEWRNGFSRGVSVSRKGKVVVYWTVIW